MTGATPGTARPTFSCVLPPSLALPTYARAAESLGYERVWLFDSPPIYGDIWVSIARAAEVTERIGFGTGVAVPRLRHVMTTASAIATIEELAPGRLVAAFGTGFTASRAIGQKPMRWADVATYVTQLRGLLDGQVVEVDGAACQMIHSPGFAPPRPIRTPLLLAPIGPKGEAVARSFDDGVVVASELAAGPEPRWRFYALLVSGTVLGPGDDHTTPRVRAALGPGWTTRYHAMWATRPDLLEGMAGAREWVAALEALPESERHLAAHEGHLVAVTERDQPLLDLAGPELLDFGWTGPPDAIARRMDAAGAAGVREVIFGPAGPAIIDELEAFASAATG
jgi:5,10-methylenetetrahydromethanopterin reductase